jgi:hypothetical protein
MSEAQYLRWLNRQVDGFCSVWEFLARQGLCDAPGSAEYHRVFFQWVQAELPDPVCLFIGKNANRPPAKEKGDV